MNKVKNWTCACVHTWSTWWCSCYLLGLSCCRTPPERELRHFRFPSPDVLLPAAPSVAQTARECLRQKDSENECRFCWLTQDCRLGFSSNWPAYGMDDWQTGVTVSPASEMCFLSTASNRHRACALTVATYFCRRAEGPPNRVNLHKKMIV